MSDRASTPEEDQVEREMPAFDARTVIDDTIGRLMHVRGRLFMDVPDGLMDALRALDDSSETAIALVEDLPRAPWDRHQGGLLRASRSNCIYEACSCGQPGWHWKPADAS